MSISLKHKNAVLTSNLNTALLAAGPQETIRIQRIIATCTTAGNGKLTLRIKDSSENSTVNLLNATSFTTGFPVEFYDGILEPNDSISGGFIGTPADPHIVFFYSSEIP